jgi:homoaconitase/3-isopropylmalate dehydratase large subunit
MEERMTVCNMAIEGGPVRLHQPDAVTFEYLREGILLPKAKLGQSHHLVAEPSHGQRR